MPLNRRAAGILLHPTSLPGRFGIGDLGPAAYKFVEWLIEANVTYWQVLPLGPTSYGDSPYQCFSSCAGNPMLISPEILVREGLLLPEEITPPPFPSGKVDYGWVINWKTGLLRRAHDRFTHMDGKFVELRRRYEKFQDRDSVKSWLADFALFMACKDKHNGEAWSSWEADLRAHKKSAVDKWRKQEAANIDFHRFNQFLFFDQWDALRAVCKRHGIEIIGDAPIYVAFDSADTWTHQELFQLDKNGLPTRVAGCPPDYFSKTGQLWGNPLYAWEKMEKDNYAWWAERLRANLAIYDIIRLDHFRGFMGYWSIPFGDPTAEFGKWVKGPGGKFFAAMEQHLGKGLPIIAEDLGEITQDVTEVRHQFHLPGMKVMQFAWGTVTGLDQIVPDPNSLFLPHQHEVDSVVYTGTHDNDTTMGWWKNSATPKERSCMQIYLSTDGNLANWDLIRASFMSVANTAVIPMQDVLGLGTEARMNYPGKESGNWAWRMMDGDIDHVLARRIHDHALRYGRAHNPPAGAVVKPQKPANY